MRSLFFISIFFLFFVNVVWAQEGNVINAIQSNNKPDEPYVQKGVCPFECCQYGSWITRSELKVYASEGDTSKVLFTMLPGSRFYAYTGNVHINKLGKVQVNEPVTRQDINDWSNQFEIRKGDTVYILSYEGEGYYNVLYHGKKTTIEEFWRRGQEGTLLQKPVMVWWVSITYNGKKGWLSLLNVSKSGFRLKESITGDDACAFDPSRVPPNPRNSN